MSNSRIPCNPKNASRATPNSGAMKFAAPIADCIIPFACPR